MIAMRGPAKSDMSSQSWATHESTMDGSHFSDEMSDEVTIEQQRKEELAVMAPPSEGSVASGSSRRSEQWVDETCLERTNEAEEEWPNSNITNEARHGLVPARGDERSYQKPNQREMGNDSLRDQGPNRERHTSHTQKRRRKAAPDVKSQAITLVFRWRVQVILPTGPC